MSYKFSKYTDQQLAQMLGTLNDGTDRLRARLLNEISFRLVRAGGGKLTNPEDVHLYGEILNFQFRQREIERLKRIQGRKGKQVLSFPARKPIQRVVMIHG